jgi:hypothetical protein
VTLDPTAVVKERWPGDKNGTSTAAWYEEKDEPHKALTGHVSALALKQRTKAILDKHHLRLYGNGDVAGTGVTDATLADLIRGDDGRMRYQLCTAIVDSAVPIVTSNKPIPYYATEGGSFSDQRKARRRTKALQGQFFELGVYDMAPLVARDAMNVGNGYIWGIVNEETGMPELERVLPQQIIVDHVENVAGDVRSVFRVRGVSRAKLMRLYKKHRKALKDSATLSATQLNDMFISTQDGSADLVMVIEAIHLPSSKAVEPEDEDSDVDGEYDDSEEEEAPRRRRKSDGRRLICTSNCTLVDEEWTDEEFPLAQMVWKHRAVGVWYGCGLVEETKSAQLRVNKLIRHQETIQNITSKVWVFLEKGSEVAPQQIVGGMEVPVQTLQYVGQPPIVYQHQAGSMDIREEIQAIKMETMEQVGLNVAHIQGEKPKGVTSAVGQRVAEDIGSRRHLENVRQYERLFVGVAKLLERLNDRASKIADKRGQAYYVNAVETRGRTEVLNRFEWKELAIDGQSTMRMYPISSLPSTPTGKWERVTEWLNTGFLTRPWAMKLLDVPDLDEALSLELVDLDTVLWHVEQIIDCKTDIVPTPHQDLALTFEIARKSWLKADMLGADEKTLSQLSLYMSRAKSMLEKSQAEAAKKAAMLAPPQVPQGVPGMDPLAPMAPAQPIASPEAMA